jgi:hypothetical protein
VEKDRLEVPIKKYPKNLEDIAKVHSTSLCYNSNRKAG